MSVIHSLELSGKESIQAKEIGTDFFFFSENNYTIVRVGQGERNKYVWLFATL